MRGRDPPARLRALFSPGEGPTPGRASALPLALDKILAGQSPYGADYSDSILGKEARVSDFWEPYGGNPILHHHAYLPGTHLLMMPFYLAARAWGGAFDPRFVTLVAYALAAWLAARVVADPARRLAAAAMVAVNPLVYWQQIFGANDLIVAALLSSRYASARAVRCWRARCSASHAPPSSWPGPLRRSCSLISRASAIRGTWSRRSPARGF